LLRVSRRGAPGWLGDTKSRVFIRFANRLSGQRKWTLTNDKHIAECRKAAVSISLWPKKDPEQRDAAGVAGYALAPVPVSLGA
jgi:hypothetical protein